MNQTDPEDPEQAVLALVFNKVTLIDDDKPELGLTGTDDIWPTDILDALGYKPPYSELVIAWSRHVGE